MKILNSIEKIISKVLVGVLFVMLVAMLAVTFSQVVARFIFGKAIFWAEEAAILCLIWTTFLGSAVAMSRDAHTKIDFAINLLPAKLKSVVEIIDYIVITVFVGMLAKYSLPIINSTGKMMTTGLKIPRSIIYYAVLFGAILIMIYCLILAIRTAVTTLKKEGVK